MACKRRTIYAIGVRLLGAVGVHELHLRLVGGRDEDLLVLVQLALRLPLALLLAVVARHVLHLAVSTVRWLGRLVRVE